MTMVPLRSGAPRISGAPQIVRGEGTELYVKVEQAYVKLSKMSTSSRPSIHASKRINPQGIRSWTSARSKLGCSDQHSGMQTKWPGQFTGLRRSFITVEKRCERVPRLNDEGLVLSVFCASNLASTTSGQHDVFQESLYRRYVDYSTQQCGQRMALKPYPVKSEFSELVGKDGKAITRSSAFQSQKIRNFRAADINGANSIQVLNLVAFPSTAYDLPIFCADLVTFAKKSVIVIDLSTTQYNSLELPTDYMEKNFSALYPFWRKYSEILPWGGEVTSEALQFFSPFVIWSRPLKDQSTDDMVFDAFKDYLGVWLDMVDKAEASNNVKEIYRNQAAQHRYMSWRSAKLFSTEDSPKMEFSQNDDANAMFGWSMRFITKDPGRPLLTKLYGETLCEDYMNEFLFAELDQMGTKTFLEYFPQFRDQSGAVQKQRKSKSYSTRPWDEKGNLMLNPSA